jgi:hypothetical protein
MRKASYRDANHYRQRADECRAIAEEYLHGDTREKMLKIAIEYQVMADRVDELARVVDQQDEQTPGHSRSRRYG